jgi:hypothetical protein
MASSLKIKRSETSGNPAVLGQGELAYSALTDNGSNGGDRLYIGTGTETAGNAVNHSVIGGKFFTDKLDHTLGVLTASSALLVDSDSKLDNIKIDNIDIDGNTISSTDANGNINITPNGSGKTIISNIFTDASTSLTTFVQGLTGNAATATALQTARTIAISGGVTGTATSFNGTANIAIAVTQIDVASASVVGILPVANGGTGASTSTGSGSVVLSVSAALTGTPTALTAASGTNTTQLATTEFVTTAVDTARSGLDVKASVVVATTANITLSGAQTVDGIALSVGDRVLVKNQTTGSQNGIYVVASGSWARSADADADAEVTSGMFTFVEKGTTNADSGFVLSTDGVIVVGTTDLVFAQFSGAGQIVAGSGLTKAGNTLSIDTGYVGQTSITTLGTVTTGVWNGTEIAVTSGGTGLTAVAARAIMFGNGTSALGVTAASSVDGSFLREDATGNPYFSNSIDGGTY